MRDGPRMGVALSDRIGSTRQKLNANGASSRPVELAEVDSLPRPERQLPVLNWHHDAGTDQRGFEVRVGVALGVAEAGLILRDVPVEPEE